MPANAHKQHCQKPGCRAWAMRGHALCATHQGRRAESAPRDALARLRSLAQRGPRLSKDDAAVLAHEVRQLRALRLVLVESLAQLREAGWEGCSPAQLLRAWADSSTRVEALLRARRELADADDLDDSTITAEDLAYVEAMPGVRQLMHPARSADAGSGGDGG